MTQTHMLELMNQIKIGWKVQEMDKIQYTIDGVEAEVTHRGVKYRLAITKKEDSNGLG